MQRPFPTPSRRRAPRVLAVAGALIPLLVVAVAVPVAQADDLKHRHQKVQKRVHHAKADLDEASAALGRAMGRVQAAKGKLDAAQARFRKTNSALAAAAAADRRMRAKLAEAQADLVRARKELAEGKRQVVQQRTDIGLMAASNYQSGDPRLMQIVVMLKSQNPGDMVTQMNTVDNLMGREQRTLDGLEQRRDQLAQQEVKVEAARQRVAERRAETRATVLRRKTLNQKAQVERNEVLRFVRERQQAAAHARKIRQADLRKLKALKRQEQGILAKIRRAAMKKRNYQGSTGGFLYRPVPGWVTSPYGWRKHPIYGYWGLHDGTDFHAPCGTHERAGASGRVAAEYYSSVWGNRLFLDVGRVNGKSMTLIYNHLSGYRVGVGAHVSRGDTIGYAGTTGWSTACHLHFTVMLNGNPVDPMGYM